MGLSFGSIGKKIQDVIGGAENFAQRDIVNPVLRVTPRPVQEAVAPPARLAAGVIGGTVAGFYRGARLPLDAGTTFAQKLALNNPNLNNNPALRQRVQQQFDENNNQLGADWNATGGSLGNLVQSVARVPVGLGIGATGGLEKNQGIVNRVLLGADKVYHPNSGVERFIFGNGPIGSYSNDYNTARKAGMTLPGAVSQTATRAAGDVLTVAAAKATADAALGTGKRISDYAQHPLTTETGSIAGPSATDFNQMSQAKRTFIGADGKPRFEIDDSQAQLKPGYGAALTGEHVGPTPLGDILQHDKLYKQYPDLANLPVAVDPSLKNPAAWNGSVLTVSPDTLAHPGQMMDSLLHETTHAIQDKEGFAPGANTGINPGVYHQSAGEAEARNVEARSELDPANRGAQPFTSTYDVPQDQQIVRTRRPAVALKKAVPSAEEINKYAESFGVSKAEAQAHLQQLADAGPVPQVKVPKIEDITQNNAEALANAPGVPGRKAPRYANTAANPVKINLPKPEPGGYDQAIINSQVVSRPLKTAGDLWIRSMKKLTPDERTSFWKSVETPDAAHSPQLTEAISRWRDVANRAHAGSQAVGGNTNYLHDYALHPWDLPEDWANANPGGGGFNGLNSKGRIHRTIAEGEAQGLTLSTDPVKEGLNYINGSSAILRKEALKNGLQMADREMTDKPHTLDLGGGHTVPLSQEGFNAAGHLQYSPASTKPVVKGIRAVNRGIKTTLLSASQFHPINIAALRAAPTLLMEGHPVRAAEGLYRTFRGAFGADYADQVIGKAMKDGTVEKAAQIGMPYGSSEWTDAGTVVKRGVGEQTVFGKQMPMMHDQVARSIISDLEKRNIPLDSPEARSAGKVGNNLMGFVNDEVQGISAKQRRAMGDYLLAGQYTPAKIGLAADSVKGGVAGSYARRANIANVAATATVIAGVGYLAKQKSDNAKDILLRALIDPAIPTPFKDQKGNTLKFRLPGTNTSDAAKLLGIELVRNGDGHLGVHWSPTTPLETIPDWMRARLGPLAGTAVKLTTNTNFAQKPLSDPNASAGTRAQQDIFSLATGDLPIGLQGLAYTKFVKDHLPSAMRDVAEAQTPGTNPVLKSGASSFGFSPTVDQTVGKGLQDKRFFDAADQSKLGLNRQESQAIDRWVGSKKNPVTGNYDIQPNVNDARNKATGLLDNPRSLDRIIEMNQKLAQQGGKVDPLWLRSKDDITKYLQYQAMPPKGPDQADWNKKNPWYIKDLQPERSKFYDSLPPGDPNKPNAPIEYPTPDSKTQGLMDQYFKISDTKAKGTFADSHPELQTQFDKQDTYWNQMRTALGYSANKTYPKATPQMQTFIDNYLGASKAQRAGIRASNPQGYKNMAAYFDSIDLYGLGKDAGVNSLQGEPDTTPKENKNIANLAKDIYQNPDGSYSLVPAGWMDGLSNGSGGGSSYGSRMTSARAAGLTPHAYDIPADAGGKTGAPKISISIAKNKVASKTSSKPKVSIKRSKV